MITMTLKAVDSNGDSVISTLKDCISQLFQSKLTYKTELSVEGLLGVTVDKKDIILVNINEAFSSQSDTADDTCISEESDRLHTKNTRQRKLPRPKKGARKRARRKPEASQKVIASVSDACAMKQNGGLKTRSRSVSESVPEPENVEALGADTAESFLQTDEDFDDISRTTSQTGLHDLEIKEELIATEGELVGVEEELSGEMMGDYVDEGDDNPEEGFVDEKDENQEESSTLEGVTMPEESTAGVVTRGRSMNTSDDVSTLPDSVVKLGDEAVVSTSARQRSFVCEHCGKAFYHNRDCRRHMRRHTTEPRHVCDVCHSAFYEEHILIKHRRSHGIKKLICDQCGRSFTDAHRLKVHVTAHQGVFPHSCALCGRGYLTKKSLQIHLKNHDKFAYRCGLCSKCFINSRSISRHMRLKHPSQ